MKFIIKTAAANVAALRTNDITRLLNGNVDSKNLLLLTNCSTAKQKKTKI